VLLLLFGFARPALAQHEVTPGAVISAPKNALESELRNEMGCTCGTCAHEALSHCTCGTAQGMRDELRSEIDQGKSKDQILAHFVGTYGGQQFLTAPLDRGFNRLAWLFPYALAGTIALVGGFVFIRKTRHPSSAPPEAKPAEDAALQARLDEELHDLD
jgi:cytochrome c-type biogenesis protein CcmH/NrfF